MVGVPNAAAVVGGAAAAVAEGAEDAEDAEGAVSAVSAVSVVCVVCAVCAVCAVVVGGVVDAAGVVAVAVNAGSGEVREFQEKQMT